VVAEARTDIGLEPKRRDHLDSSFMFYTDEASALPEGRYVELLFRLPWPTYKTGFPTADWRTVSGISGRFVASAWWEGKVRAGYVGFGLLGKQATVELSFADTTYQKVGTVAVRNGGSAKLPDGSRVSLQKHSFLRAWDGIRVPQTRVTVTPSHALKGRDVCLQLYEMSGKERSSLSSNHFVQRFENAPSSRMKVTVLSRPWKKLVFKNIPLQINP
jgi:hypothetical protein